MGWLDFLTGGAGALVTSIGDAIDKNVTSDEERLKLKNELAKLETDYKLKVYEFQVREDEITQKDREDARNREIELAKLGKHAYRQNILAAVAVLGMVALAWFALTKDIRERDIFLMIIGVAIAKINDIYGYDFGSSRGSAMKDEILSRR